MSKGVYNVLSRILRTFFIKSRFVGFHRTLQSYSVCIANHLGSFGPVAIMSSLSTLSQKLDPWVTHQVTDLKQCAEYLRRDFVEKELKLRSTLAERLSNLLGRICVDLMNTIHAIPVYKHSRQVFKTFELSLARLKAGRTLLIFPENDESKAAGDDVCRLDAGFIGIARWVFQNTRRRLRFYPVAINPQARAVQLGRPVLFNPRVPFRQERQRIKEELERRITRMYAALAVEAARRRGRRLGILRREPRQGHMRQERRRQRTAA